MEEPNRLVTFIVELRKTILLLVGAIVASTIGFYFLSPDLLHILQAHLHQKLAFFTVAEPFLAHVKLAFAVAIFALMPLIVYALWKALAKPFGLSGRSMAWFVVFTCCLFYAGAGFCYFITLPFGINFLLGFQTEQLRPVISIGRFVAFVTIFILAFGVIFELPIFMIFCARVGLCPRRSFEKNRRYALLAISIAAALLTPTPDVVNMLLMGLPLYMLYEAGIIVLRMLKID